MAERLSPLARVTPVSADDLKIAEIPFLTQVNLRVAPKSRAAADIGLALGAPLPVEPGTYTSAGPDVLWLGPDEWLVVEPEGHDLEKMIRTAAGDAHAGIIDVSAQRTVIT